MDSICTSSQARLAHVQIALDAVQCEKRNAVRQDKELEAAAARPAAGDGPTPEEVAEREAALEQALDEARRGLDHMRRLHQAAQVSDLSRSTWTCLGRVAMWTCGCRWRSQQIRPRQCCHGAAAAEPAVHAAKQPGVGGSGARGGSGPSGGGGGCRSAAAGQPGSREGRAAGAGAGSASGMTHTLKMTLKFAEPWLLLLRCNLADRGLQREDDVAKRHMLDGRSLRTGRAHAERRQRPGGRRGRHPGAAAAQGAGRSAAGAAGAQAAAAERDWQVRLAVALDTAN
jgi:hypothetical protein